MLASLLTVAQYWVYLVDCVGGAACGRLALQKAQLCGLLTESFMLPQKSQSHGGAAGGIA